MLEFLQEKLQEEWHPTSRIGVACWLVFYGLFTLYAGLNNGGFLAIDNVNLVVHEGGHLLFAWFGETVCLWGGTVLQWLVPALLAASFFWQRQVYGFVFCGFMFFENFLYTATYMADARAQALPLVTVGDPDAGGHDWFNILSSLGLLQYDTRIAAIVRLAGWLGMVGMVVWFALRLRSQAEPSS